ncbi:MAG: hypothetical protein ACLR8Y_08850 [Alistipes indistinctus]
MTECATISRDAERPKCSTSATRRPTCQMVQRPGGEIEGQAYGRGFFPLEAAHYDIPEKWTTNYLKHRLGEEMPNGDYRRG